MAEILVASVGTKGDVQPLLALAEKLSSAGHSVSMATDRYHYQEGANVRWEFVDSLSKDEIVRSMYAASSKPDTTFRGNYVGQCIGEAFRRNTPDFPQLCQKFDLVIMNILALIGFPGMKLQESGPLKSFAFYFPLEPELARACRSPNFVNLMAISRHLAPEMSYYGNLGYEMTGFWLPPAAQDRKLCQTVSRFLEAGDPPVLVTLGSMATKDATKYSDLIIRSLIQTGQRAIVQRGWGDFFSNRNLGKDILLVDEMNHEAILPYVSCVIHHGGCGTTATVARAGKISIVMPQLADQTNWAAFLVQKGASAGTVYPWDVEESDLSDMIARAVGDTSLRTAAADLGSALSSEDGTTLATTVINEALKSKGLPPRPGTQRPDSLRKESTGATDNRCF